MAEVQSNTNLFYLFLDVLPNFSKAFHFHTDNVNLE